MEKKNESIAFEGGFSILLLIGFIGGLIVMFISMFTDNEDLKGISAIIASISFIILFIMGRQAQKEESSKVREVLDRYLEDIFQTHRIQGELIEGWDQSGDLKALMICSNRPQIVIINIQGNIDIELACKNALVQKINFNKIIEVKVLSNSSTVTATSRGSQVGGALVGGVLLGGTGAIIGGLSGKTKTNESIRNLSLEIVIDDISNPVIEIPFHTIKQPELKFGTDNYERVTKEINNWYRKFTVILHQQAQLKEIN
ncbi:hypothetical protein ABZ756_03095 [Mammaliicoccus sciuri]